MKKLTMKKIVKILAVVLAYSVIVCILGLESVHFSGTVASNPFQTVFFLILGIFIVNFVIMALWFRVSRTHVSFWLFGGSVSIGIILTCGICVFQYFSGFLVQQYTLGLKQHIEKNISVEEFTSELDTILSIAGPTNLLHTNFNGASLGKLFHGKDVLVITQDIASQPGAQLFSLSYSWGSVVIDRSPFQQHITNRSKCELPLYDKCTLIVIFGR